MRIVVITSCTGEKTVASESALTLEDFKKGGAHVRRREKDLKALMRSAEEIYSGQQHVRLMRGVRELRDAFAARGNGSRLDLYVLSAGYGLVPSDRHLAPYEATFQGMKKGELRRWADTLEVPSSFRDALRPPYDLGLLLLGDDYLSACALDDSVELGGPTIVFCGKNTVGRLPKLALLHPVPLTNQEAKRFSCGLVALKGELAAKILQLLGSNAGAVAELTSTPRAILEKIEEVVVPNEKTPKARAQAKPDVDYVISIPKSWYDRPHREKLRYFIPEWDDLVDRDYDFENDIHSGGSGDWSNEVYAHQLYSEPNYDGILISKVVAEKSKKKKERINRLGVHRFLRVPREFPIMGDCGAFGYIGEKVPPYTTDEILDYYTRLDFDYGVSIDHLIVTATESEKQERYNLTIENAADFLEQHKKAKLPWTPIGAVQGWDPQSYADAAKKYVAMGYQYIALGGLVRTSTPQILDVLRKVHDVVPSHVKIHLFGLARIGSMQAFADLGVRSVDSASLLRRAWMGTGQNYLSIEGKFYTAIRVPAAGKSFRAKRMVTDGRASGESVEQLESQSMEILRRFDAGYVGVNEVLDTLEDYDRLITPDRPPTRELLRETLEARPWQACTCDICRRDGIQVIIFRGNNRNRRRGFHNTCVFYQLLQRVLAGEQITFNRSSSTGSAQLGLFASEDETVETADAL